MANTIKLKRSAVQGKAPSVNDLELGEIGLNTYDGKLYIKKDDGSPSIVEIGGSSSILTSKRFIDSNVTIASGFNAMSIGDVEVDTGVSVEIPQDSLWLIVS